MVIIKVVSKILLSFSHIIISLNSSSSLFLSEKPLDSSCDCNDECTGSSV